MSIPAVDVTQKETVRGLERSQIVQSSHSGTMPYEQAAAWQANRAQAIAAGSKPEIIVFLEHTPVYTQGRRGGREHVLRTLGAPIIDTDRGGDVTFHGPGQLVIWPILRLRERGIGIARYIRCLEESVIQATRSFGLEAERVKGRPGVWIGNRKLASVGVRMQSGVSRHGLALNCDVDLSWFDDIRACGIAESRATSLSNETGKQIGVDDASAELERCIGDVFGLRLSPVSDLRMLR